eukprot:5252870-Amphidinium_carterae.1
MRLAQPCDCIKQSGPGTSQNLSGQAPPRTSWGRRHSPKHVHTRLPGFVAGLAGPLLLDLILLVHST